MNLPDSRLFSGKFGFPSLVLIGSCCVPWLFSLDFSSMTFLGRGEGYSPWWAYFGRAKKPHPQPLRKDWCEIATQR
jgi:hypothetical protein